MKYCAAVVLVVLPIVNAWFTLGPSGYEFSKDVDVNGTIKVKGSTVALASDLAETEARLQSEIDNVASSNVSSSGGSLADENTATSGTFEFVSNNFMAGVANTFRPGVKGVFVAGGGDGDAIFEANGTITPGTYPPNSALDNFAFIGGGSGNTAGSGFGAHFAVVGGGDRNHANGSFSVVSGGMENTAGTDFGVVGGGDNNVISSSSFATIGGGKDNAVSGGVNGPVIAGGVGNTIGNSYSTVSGGENNQANGLHATVLGGYANKANGDYSIAGGSNSEALATNSIALGQYAYASHDYSIVIAAGTPSLTSTESNDFTIGASGGFRVFTAMSPGTPSLYVNESLVQAIDTVSVMSSGGMDTINITPFSIASSNPNFRVISSAVWYGGMHSSIDDNPTDYVLLGGSNTLAAKGNTVFDSVCTIVGGTENACGKLDGNAGAQKGATVVGGDGNIAEGQFSVTVGGQGLTASALHSTVVGGNTNTASGAYSAIVGGQGNSITAEFGVVSGGKLNTASAEKATVGGGESNLASSGQATVGGGMTNTASGASSVVGGGRSNAASNTYATVAGGEANTVSSIGGAIGGGQSNSVGGLDGFAAGTSNSASGAHSVALGKTASAPAGSFVFSDGTSPATALEDQFAVLATGGIELRTSESPSRGVFISDFDGLEVRGDIASVKITPNGIDAMSSENFTIVTGNVLIGSAESVIQPGSEGCVVLGGGNMVGYENSAGGEFATAVGGKANLAAPATGEMAAAMAVVGGEYNEASGDCSVVAAGVFNVVSEHSSRGSIVGGQYNSMQASDSFIAGGYMNTVTESASNAAVVGGTMSQATDANAAVVGGSSNEAVGKESFVGGGSGNKASGINAAVIGGDTNIASAENAAVIAGDQNEAVGKGSIAAGFFSSASGMYSVAMGESVLASGLNSYAFGNNVQANSANSFAFGDGSAATLVDTANSFTVRATGGAKIYTTTGSVGASIDPGDNSWNILSARDSKQNITLVDDEIILDLLTSQVPIYNWRYKDDPFQTPHIGAIAEEFFDAFHLGRSRTSIPSGDSDGIALASIRGLYKKLMATEQELTLVKEEVSDMKADIAQLKSHLNL
mmetsp:Transcript_28792/g.73697  ORF Transcript_28792/g.73697 Transcript_28792/m.73697 type:complete len:1095 (-) Transcript_28792:41-3325(-)